MLYDKRNIKFINLIYKGKPGEGPKGWMKNWRPEISQRERLKLLSSGLDESLPFFAFVEEDFSVAYKLWRKCSERERAVMPAKVTSLRTRVGD